jgi:hypothetical protein
MSVRVSVASAVADGHAAMRLRGPAVLVLNVAVRVRRESGFGEPWKRPCAIEMDGRSAGHEMATSTVGVDELAETRATVQLECAQTASRVTSGVAPDWQTFGSRSALTQIVVESVGDVDTIEAVTSPGPSLMNVNVRAA